MIIGYARVSLIDQNMAKQVNDLNDFGCEKVFTENLSIHSFQNRQTYQSIRTKLRCGDVLVVHDLSHFGREQTAIRDEWESLMKDEIDIVVLNLLSLDIRKHKETDNGELISDLVHNLLSWMVEVENNTFGQPKDAGLQWQNSKVNIRVEKRNTMQMQQVKIKLHMKRLLTS